ncbi:MAG: hypothetical protein KDJ75_08295 [Alphaproteobacteria bacterium]|nr:hypothetical protein [Alphaproteobacteria bacterium]
MPYLILVFGVLIGLYALFRFFVNAEIAQVKAAMIAGGFGFAGLALLFLAMSGRLVPALVLLAAMSFAGVLVWRKRCRKKRS